MPRREGKTHLTHSRLKYLITALNRIISRHSELSRAQYPGRNILVYHKPVFVFIGAEKLSVFLEFSIVTFAFVPELFFCSLNIVTTPIITPCFFSSFNKRVFFKRRL